VRGKRRVGLLAVDHMVQAHNRRDMPKPWNLLRDGRADFGFSEIVQQRGFVDQFAAFGR
jgi:hypothetical protein